MSEATNRRVVLAERPVGMPGAQHLVLETASMPVPASGQMLLRTIYLSLDPYMRGRMSAARSYSQPVEIGEVMVGGTVSEVVESRLEGYAAGDIVLSANGWQEYAVSDGTGVRKLDPTLAPISTAVGVLGMPGFTAYAGLREHGRPQAGETVVVSAAAGAVGQVVGQLAKLWGCRAVGIAGGEDKCRYVVDELGFAAAVNYKADDFAQQLAAACPQGIDVYFENVAGPVLEAVLPLFNDFARMPVCGTIAYYNLTQPPAGPDKLPQMMRAILTRRLSVRGFIQFDHLDLLPEFLQQMSGWIRDGKIKYREDIVRGLENAAEAFQGLLQGRNNGKLIIQVGADPTQA